MQASKEDSVHPNEDFRNAFNPDLSTDDTVFQGAISVFLRNNQDRCYEGMPASDQALWHLINMGAKDMPLVDKPWDASTRSMRFATCLADRLWVMVKREQNRVHCRFLCLVVYKETDTFSL